MTEAEGKIFLSGFELEPAEKAIADNVIKSYSHKIKERAGYDYIKLSLKKSQRGRVCLHKVRGTLKKGALVLTSKAEDYNLFSAIAEVLEKLLNELVHKSRTSRQRR